MLTFLSNDEGLSLLLNIHENDMIDARSIFNGLVIFIHPHTESIDSAMSKKIFVPPGSLNNIHVTISKVSSESSFFSFVDF